MQCLGKKEAGDQWFFGGRGAVLKTFGRCFCQLLSSQHTTLWGCMLAHFLLWNGKRSPSWFSENANFAVLFFFLHQLWCWEEAAGGLCSVFPEVYDEFLGFLFLCCCLVSDCFLTLGLLLCKQTHLLLKWGWLQWCHVLINKCRFNIYYINIDILYQYLTYIILQHFE